MKSAAVIGAGFSGLSAACFLARDGFDVTVFEKNQTPGGRARQFRDDGFVFDMGPSWYWMPDVFEKFFAAFDKHPSDYYRLKRLDPSYRIYFGPSDAVDLPATAGGLHALFDSIERGAGTQLKKFLAAASVKYRLALESLIYKKGLSLADLFTPELMRASVTCGMFGSLSAHIRKYFKDQRLISILEFPVLFLGATPSNTPALYSLMNHADMTLGTWYPMGGMYEVVNAMYSLARKLGVSFRFNEPVGGLPAISRKSIGLRTEREHYLPDYVVASADYHDVEQRLLPASMRKYSENYWNKRVLAPSSLIFYLGINKKVNGLLHHTLFFDESFELHASQIYQKPNWPAAPQFYVSCPSKTDPTVAPAGSENLMILVPVAAGLTDTEEIRELYFDLILTRIKKITGEDLRPHIVYRRSYAHNDFSRDYHAFRGNAYGLANTLLQTANLKPSVRSPKARNLFFAGHLTVPGPGVPPALISGQIASEELLRQHRQNNHKYESTI